MTMRFSDSHSTYVALALMASCAIPSIAPAVTSEEARKAFQNPPVEYSSGPLWVWNDLLTDEQIITTIHDMAAQHVRQVFVHPRPGLATPYLSPEWFRLYKVAIAEAEKLGMKVWMYDENSYPSGFAGGHVMDVMPEARQMGLQFHDHKSTPPKEVPGYALGLFHLKGDIATSVPHEQAVGAPASEGTYMTAALLPQRKSGWLAGHSSVDLMNPAVTDKFIEVTFEAYRKEIGEHFGKMVPGMFTDEPNIRASDLPWSSVLSDAFQKRWGYDLIPVLPSLTRHVGDWKRIRHNYWQLLNELFAENWGRRVYEYCDRNKLEFTGHYWEHGWPMTHDVPDNMAMYAWQHRPGIDCLMNVYDESTHGQFGNARMVRELGSVANQFGRARTLCEIYGAGGWDMRFEDQKRIADWLAVLGVNTFNQHLSYISLRGARKRDHPLSFSYHTPWWRSYSPLADYLARLSVAASQGEQINSILLLQPTTTAYMYQAEPDNQEKLGQLGRQFQELLTEMERAQVEYDIGSEYIIGSIGKADGKTFVVGKGRYTTVIVPPLMENINVQTLKLLEQFVKAGGSVLCGGDAPSLVDGTPSDRVQSLTEEPSWKKVDAKILPQTVAKASADEFGITRQEDDKGILFHQRRKITDGEILLLVNTSIDHPSNGSFQSKLESAEQWNLETGTVSPYPAAQKDGRLEAAFALPPCGSLTILLSGKSAADTSIKPQAKESELPPSGSIQVHREEPNVLTLDYVDLKTSQGAWQNHYFYKAQEKVFAAHGLPANPWDNAVQFKESYLKMQLPSDGGFEATYKFYLADKVPADLQFVVERADLYSITCNDTVLTSSTQNWWLDKQFGKLDISKAARVGENRVTIKASPFTIFHELEPAYLLGSFTLQSRDNGFAVHETTAPLRLGAWSTQGHPFYGAGVKYTQSFNVADPKTTHLIRLGKWHGGVAEVHVNGVKAGIVGWAPWECDVTKHLKAGSNDVTVTVIGTPRNLLGPHHHSKVRGAAWPGMFKSGPETGPPAGTSYDVLDYGMFEPFKLLALP